VKHDHGVHPSTDGQQKTLAGPAQIVLFDMKEETVKHGCKDTKGWTGF
jgi:hypothetical protein